MKNVKTTAFALVIAVLLSLPSSAGNGTAFNWYCKKGENGENTLDPDFEFIKKHGGYYLDDDTEEKVIYLTFDAGYENGNVEKIVDTLNSHGAKGAFFILDNLINRNPDLVKKMSDSGHTVCNHTAKHHDMTKFHDYDQFKRELSSLSDSYFKLTGRDMAMYFRPPEGRFSEESLCYAEKLGYKTIFWSFAYADWDNNKQPDPEKAYEKVIAATHPGEVILLHPTSATNAAIMDRLLCYWENEGYRFGTLDELCAP